VAELLALLKEALRPHKVFILVVVLEVVASVLPQPLHEDEEEKDDDERKDISSSSAGAAPSSTSDDSSLGSSPAVGMASCCGCRRAIW